MFNASDTLGRMLHSIVGQSYDNWRIELIDDVSDEAHVNKCSDTIEKFDELMYPVTNKINVTYNAVKQWEVANVLRGISTCADDSIVCRIDGDDWLVDLDALAIINAYYESTQCDALWTAHRWGFSDQNISAMMPDDVDPYVFPWVSSHMKTFRKRLINGVKHENFLGQDGEFIRRAGDQCIYLPVLHNAKKRLYVPRVMYHYSIDVTTPGLFFSEDSVFQKNEAEFLRARGFVS